MSSGCACGVILILINLQYIGRGPSYFSRLPADFESLPNKNYEHSCLTGSLKLATTFADVYVETRAKD